MTPYLRPEGTQLRQGGPEPPAAVRHEAHPLDLLLAIMGDPRNSWMGGPGKILHGAEALPALVGGLGPLFKSGRGWEVLREYIAKGGTPASLRALLRERGYGESTVGSVGRDVRAGTELAAPPGGRTADARHDTALLHDLVTNLRERYPAKAFEGPQPTLDQQRVLESAAQKLQREERDARRGLVPTTASAKSTVHGALEEAWQARGNAPSDQAVIPAGNQGQAAYQAISSRMGRLLDDPNFLAVKRHFVDLPPVSDAHYYAEFPVHGGSGDGALPPALWGHGPGGLYAAQDARTAALNQRLDAMARPRTFAAAENQRTSDLNRRADARQGGVP